VRHLLLLLVTLTASPALADAQTRQARLENLSADDVLAIAGKLIDTGQYQDAQVLLDRLAADQVGGTERDFLDGMIALAKKDHRRAEALFRGILDANPKLVRVRLELARTLFMANKDEEADYHFRLAAAERPPEAVIRNVARFREAIRARRAWRFNVELGVAPDTNINSATAKDRVEILGLPFQLDPDAKARSGVGLVAGGSASVRLWRFARVPFYVGAYGRMVHYADQRFDDIYVGGEAGPEFHLAGGRLRVAGAGLLRWYGGKRLMMSAGGRLAYDKLLGGNWGMEASISIRHNQYAHRDDVDGWDVEATLALNRALGPSTVGFAYGGMQRSIATDPGNSSRQVRIGLGVLHEIGWGLRPQIDLEAGRQVYDAKLGLFGKSRRDWRLHASASVYKRDWNVMGFAPSFRLIWTRNASTIALYNKRRLRAEFGATKAF